jgi:hypothetical protein
MTPLTRVGPAHDTLREDESMTATTGSCTPDGGADRVLADTIGPTADPALLTAVNANVYLGEKAAQWWWNGGGGSGGGGGRS